MLAKLSQILIILFILSYIQLTHQYCLNQHSRIKSIMRRNYQNVLKSNSGDLISSKNNNGFAGNNDGVFLRDTIYKLQLEFGFVWCYIGRSIQLNFLQKYEINTIKIWFYDLDIRFYKVEVFIKLENTETKIYGNNLAQSIITITFPAQQVESFRIYNTNGNTLDDGLQVQKAEAYYKFSDLQII